MNSDKSGIRRRLLDARTAAELSQKELAEELTRMGHKVNRQQVSRWEAGQGSPTLEEFKDLCVVLNVIPSLVLLGVDLCAEVSEALRAVRGAKARTS